MSLAVVESVPLDGHPLAEAIELERQNEECWDLRAFGYVDGRVRKIRFRHRPDRRKLGATDISQDWLHAVAQEWVFRNALRKVHGTYLFDAAQAVALLSGTLRERPDAGDRPAALRKADLRAHLERLGQMRRAGRLSASGHEIAVRHMARVLEDAQEWDLTAATGPAAGLPEDFIVARSERPKMAKKDPDEVGDALPRAVMRQLLSKGSLAALEARSGAWAVRWFKVAVATGRRPGEVVNLPLEGALATNTELTDGGDEIRRYVLVVDMPKVGICGYRLPITAEAAAVIEEQRTWVQATYPDTPAERLPLFPAPWHNTDGIKAVNTQQTGLILRRWVAGLEDLSAPTIEEDGRATGVGPDGQFDRRLIYAYALRHTYAQDHADAGTPLEVLQDLMGHEKASTTQGYFRMTQTRRRDAVNRLSRHRISSSGSLVRAGMEVIEREEELRHQVGSVAVPFGQCVEPTNVQAGGHACPFRMRCVGCSMFRTDPSYLPELKEYLTQLLASRERLQTTTGLDEWARRDAMPSSDEVDRVRFLIRRCEEEVDQLGADERAEIERCIALARAGRSGVAAVVPLELLGIARADEPDLFPSAFDRLNREAKATSGVVR